MAENCPLISAKHVIEHDVIKQAKYEGIIMKGVKTRS
jgi:hypothetical protein